MHKEKEKIKGYKKENYTFSTSGWAKTERKSWFFQVIVWSMLLIPIIVLTVILMPPVLTIVLIPPLSPSVMLEINLFYKVVLVLIIVPLSFMGFISFNDYLDKHNCFVPLSKAGIWVGEIDEDGYEISEMRFTSGAIVDNYRKALEEETNG